MNVLSLYAVYALFTSTMPYLLPPAPKEEDVQSLPIYNLEAGGEVSSDRVGLIEGTDDAFNIRLELVNSAEETLDIVYHAMGSGDCATMFLDRVYAAAERGVKVKLLLDGTVGVGDGALRKDLIALDGHENITCRGYSPARLLKPWKWHALLHDKMILTDGRYLVAGGRNISDKYYAPTGYGGKVTNDRDIFIWGGDVGQSVLLDAVAYFDCLWTFDETVPIGISVKNEEKRIAAIRERAGPLYERNPQFMRKNLKDYCGESVEADGILLLINPIESNVKQPYIGHQLYRIMKSAKERVVVQTPYATKTNFFLNALENRPAETEFTLLTNSMASTPNIPAFSNYYTNRDLFLERGAEIFEYQSEDSIHGKSIIVDSDLSIVGSFNMDARSLYIDTESMFAIKSEAFTALLEDAMGRYMEESRCICEADCAHKNPVKEHPVPAVKRVGMQLAALLSNPFGFLI